MICIICGKEFFHSKIKKNTCSKLCTEKKWYQNNKEKIRNKYYEKKNRWNEQ